MVRTYHQNNATSVGAAFGQDEPKFGRRASSRRCELVGDLVFESSLPATNSKALVYQNSKAPNTCCDHCTSSTSRHNGNPVQMSRISTGIPSTPLGSRHLGSGGSFYILPPYPQTAFVPHVSGLPLKPVKIGLCQGCQQLFGNYPDTQSGSMDFGTNQLQSAQREQSGPGQSAARASNSDGYLSRHQRSQSVPQSNRQDYDMRTGLSELGGALQRLQNTNDDNILDENDYLGRGSYYEPDPGTTIPMELEDFARKSWSAPTNNPYEGDFLDKRQDPGGYQGHHPVSKQISRPEPQSQAPQRRGRGPQTKSAYRRDLEAQMKDQQMRKEREKEDIRAEKFGINHDPMDHMHGRSIKPDRAGGYSPSLIEGHNRSRRGGNEPPPSNAGKSGTAMEMAEARARKDRDKKGDSQDWWEKRTEPDHFGESPTKPHPAQPKPGRAKQQPKPDRMSYEDELKAQIEDKKRRDEEEKRKEREEDERFDRRLREQQEKLNAELEEEKIRKREKEESKSKRQDEMAKKQREMKEGIDRANREAAEVRAKERNAAAKQASQVARERSPSPEPDLVPFRSDSPPIPSLRGKGGARSQPPSDPEEIANQLSTMRDQLDKHQEEHDSVWNGLVEV